MSARKVMVFYWLWAVSMVAAYFTVPSLGPLIWGLLGVSSVACVVYGVLRYRPRKVLPWALLALGLLAFVAGDTTYSLLVFVRGDPNPYPSLADVAYLAMYPFIATGLYGLARSGIRYRDRVGLLDSLTLTAGIALALWTFHISPRISDPGLAASQKLAWIAYPLGDILVLAMMIQLANVAKGIRAILFLVVGGCSLLVTDIVYGAIQTTGTWQVGGPIDLGWALSYVVLGSAALDPTMVRVTEPRTIKAHPISLRRMIVIGLASLVPTAILMSEALEGEVRDGVVIAVLSAVTFGLMFARLYGVLVMYRAALSRENVLGRAGVAMVAATELEDVEAAVRSAAMELLPAGAGYKLLFVEDRQSGTGAGAGLCYTRDLEPRVAASCGEFEIALRCPLNVGRDDGPARRPATVLMLAALEDTLVGLEQTFEVLAAHTAMAVERIGLSNEISRRRSEEYFRTLVLNMSDIILILNDDDRVQYASPSASDLFGFKELTRRSLYELIRPEDQVAVRGSVDSMRAGCQTAGDWNVVRVDGDVAQVEVSFQDLRRDETVGGLVLTMRDVTERRRLELELTYQAFHDALTGLANRALFTERMCQAIARGRQSGAVIGVLIIDLDDFKVINDSMGHGLGDQLLVAVGHRLVGAVRSTDTVARLGGDEFAVLVEEANGVEDVEHLADRLLAALTEPVPLGGQIVACAASVGLTISQETTDDAQELLTRADLALYMAKSTGKGRRAQYEPTLHNAIRRRLELRAELDQSLTDGDFLLYYQPIVDLGTGKPVGVEALVRWNHPVKGLMGPGKFIDVAEETGLIVPLGSWVLREAIATIARWRDERPAETVPYISVNVSVAQFRTPDFVDQVIAALGEYRVPAAYLLLEITESLLLRDDERVWTDLLALRRAGVRVAIDDFGTGYSALSYLRQVPIDIVKIDKSFVETVSISAQQRALVNGIIGLTNTLGLVVVAEGIEQSTERDILCEIGCALGQGFLFARPMSYGDAIQWMRAAEVAA